MAKHVPGKGKARPSSARKRSVRAKPAKSAKPKRKTPREQRIARERHNLGANINYQYWVVGYSDRHAADTGVKLSLAQVRRSKDFQTTVNVVLGHNPNARHGPRSALARALIKLGVRDPSFKGNVGNSPNARKRIHRPKTYTTLGRRGLGRSRNSP